MLVSGSGVYDVLAPKWTPELLSQKGKCSVAANMYQRRSASLAEAAAFADVPEAWLSNVTAEVSIDQRVLSGTPCLQGTRVPAHYVADMVENGDAVPEILAAYPYLTESQINAAVAYVRAFPQLARPASEPPWRRRQPIVTDETSLDDLPRSP